MIYVSFEDLPFLTVIIAVNNCSSKNLPLASPPFFLMNDDRPFRRTSEIEVRDDSDKTFLIQSWPSRLFTPAPRGLFFQTAISSSDNSGIRYFRIKSEQLMSFYADRSISLTKARFTEWTSRYSRQLWGYYFLSCNCSFFPGKATDSYY